MNMTIYFQRYLPVPDRIADKERQKEISLSLLKRAVLDSGLAYDQLTLKSGEHGKPYFENNPLYFNFSHTSGMVLLACGSGELGADCEKIRRFPSGAARRVCTADELHTIKTAASPDHEFFRVWTYKEAFVKYVGDGISYPMKSVPYKNGGFLNDNAIGLECNSGILDGYAFAVIGIGAKSASVTQNPLNLC